MTNNRLSGLSTMTMRQKVMTVVLILIVGFVLYQVKGLFGGGGGSATPVQTAANGNGAAPQPPIQKPQLAEALPRQSATSIQAQEALRAQQENQAQYIASLNQLQALKVAKDIAETNHAIIAAKLATITAQKSIVDLLSRPTGPISSQSYAQGLVNPAGAGGPGPQGQPLQNEASYTVISVSQLQGKWGAVLGSQGSLYSVSAGDILPADKSVVISIDKSGVLLQKDGVEKKVSLVPII